MSHSLNIENGQAALMYAGEPPWHGLGTRVSGLATSAQAIKVARLDWEVDKLPPPPEIPTTPPAAAAWRVVRRDPGSQFDGAVLGRVPEDFTPLQNREAFAFFDSIVGEDEAVYETAGALGRGEKVWMLARMAGEIRVAGDDVVEPYLLLSNSHDGSGGVQLRFTPVRVVCWNTLTMALHMSRGIEVSHTPDLRARLEQAAASLGLIKRGLADLGMTFQQMARLPLTSRTLHGYLSSVFPYPPGRGQVVDETRTRDLRADASRLFETGKGNTAPRVRGTLWAAYNAVTELVDHHRNNPSNDDGLRNIWFGEGAGTKVRAYECALELLRVQHGRETLASTGFRPREARRREGLVVDAAGAPAVRGARRTPVAAPEPACNWQTAADEAFTGLRAEDEAPAFCAAGR
jgi:phage/plasmid-like protein (TIGR03299 family)